MDSTHPILEVKNLNISYVSSSGIERVIVSNGNFSVNPGELVLIIGQNGSGKSSIFKSIVGDLNNDLFLKIKLFLKNLFKKQKSSFNQNKHIFFKGNEILNDNDLSKFRQSIGYASQEDDVDSFFERNVWNYVLDYISVSTGYTTLSTTDLEEIANDVYNKLSCDKYCEGKLKKMKLKKCSGGEKKITSLLAALSRKNADLIILDEPINNLDAYHARKLNNYLVDLKSQENPPGILIITHCPMFLGVDKVYELKNGKIQLINKDFYKTTNCFGSCNYKTKKYIEEE